MIEVASCVGTVKYIRRGLPGARGSSGPVWRQHVGFVSAQPMHLISTMLEVTTKGFLM